MGTGERPQYEVGARMADARGRFPFDLVLMLGDNLYIGDKPQDYRKAFEQPYGPLLDVGVRFFAVLGNHDSRSERFYAKFNMNGRSYYTFAPVENVRFFGLESDYMTRDQLEWLERELQGATEAWRIVLMHHPIYSSGGTHGSSLPLRRVLEPLFIKYGVTAVFAGHEHFYERIKPQNDVTYFISGGGGKVRKGDLHKNSPLTAAGFDTDNHFMLIEIDGDQMYFEAVSRAGATVDSGVVRRRGSTPVSGSRLRAPDECRPDAVSEGVGARCKTPEGHGARVLPAA
jgi:3',5'-cyclic AMP phosphodiesterase CpdA